MTRRVKANRKLWFAPLRIERQVWAALNFRASARESAWMYSAIVAIALAAAGLRSGPTAIPEPATLIVPSGDLKLRALVWRPAGSGPFPAVLFNHGSYSTADEMPESEPRTLGSVFARHGYVFMFLFRQGIGLSIDEGMADGALMDRALASGGQQARNEVQLQLLQNEELNEARAGLESLAKQPDVDPRRIALVGHSFGGSLSLILSENEPSTRALVLFAPASGSWDRSPPLRERINSSLARLRAPVFLIYAQNDYSLGSAKALPKELQRLGKSHELRIYPPVGATQRDGHNLLYRSVPTWEADVFSFLDRFLRPAQPR